MSKLGHSEQWYIGDPMAGEALQISQNHFPVGGYISLESEGLSVCAWYAMHLLVSFVLFVLLLLLMLSSEVVEVVLARSASPNTMFNFFMDSMIVSNTKSFIMSFELDPLRQSGHMLCLESHDVMQSWWYACPQLRKREGASHAPNETKQILQHGMTLSIMWNCGTVEKEKSGEEKGEETDPHVEQPPPSHQR